MYSEATMPGDVATMDSTGIAEGQSIWNRMARAALTFAS